MDEDVVDKDVAYLMKNFQKFLKFKKNGKFAEKGKFPSFGKEKKNFKRKDGKESQSTQGVTCFKCNGYGHFKKECPNYLKIKGKVYATTFSDLDSSNFDSEESCDGEGNYSTFMTIARVEFLEDLSLLVEELREHSDEESMGVVEKSNVEEDESTAGLQENYNSLLKKSREYTGVAKVAVKKIKKADEDYRSLLVRYKEAKCEIKTLNGELTKAYTKVKFLELKVVQANAKMERVSSKKLDEVLAHQKMFSNKRSSGYTGESNLAANISKEVKFVKAKEPMVVAKNAKKVKLEKKKNVTDQRFITKQLVVKPKGNGKSLPKSQRGPRTQYLCHHYGIQGHTRPNCHKLQALKNSGVQRSRGPRNDKRNWAIEQLRGRDGDSRMMDVIKMIDAFTTCLASFNKRFGSHNTRTQSYKDITPNARDVWVKRGTHA